MGLPGLALVLAAIMASPSPRAAATRTQLHNAESPRQPGAIVPPWTVTFKKGDISVHSRTLLFSESASGGKSLFQIEVKSTETVEIRDVNGRGEATVASICQSMQVRQDDRVEAISGARFPTTNRIYGKNGLLLREIDTAQAPTDPILVAEGVLANFPAPVEPVRPGSVWRTDLPNPLLAGRRATLVSRYLGTRSITGSQVVGTAFTLQLATTAARAPGDDISASGERWLDPATGRQVRLLIELRNVAFSAQGTTRHGTVRIVDEITAPTADAGSAESSKVSGK